MWSPYMTYEAADHTRSLPDPARADCTNSAKAVADKVAIVCCFDGEVGKFAAQYWNNGYWIMEPRTWTLKIKNK